MAGIETARVTQRLWGMVADKGTEVGEVGGGCLCGANWNAAGGLPCCGCM